MADGSLGVIQADLPAGLTYCSDETPGITRRGAGRGFAYRAPDGQPVRDAIALARIRKLAIPPAWTNVWICPRANGHIQATGRDAKGRKQYRYHDAWSENRSGAKFDKMPAFARALPRLRRQVEIDLAKRGPCREKVLATVVRLLEISLIRVGNKQYALQNRSYGLTTLHKRHLEVGGTAITFAFKGKSGVDHRVSVRDRRLAGVVRSLRELPGQTLFKYRNEAGELTPVTSDDVNGYIRCVMGDGFSAKDFRTWAGTVSAARALRELSAPGSKTEASRMATTCVKAVAGLLGNTASVCRAAYIHPKVFEAYQSGELVTRLPGPDAQGFEKALIKLIES